MIVTKKQKHGLITYYILEVTKDSPWMFDIEMLVKPNINTSKNANKRYHGSNYIFSTCHDLDAKKTMTKL